jgi:thiosulfate/3-mercaptopyruvate sulfurtransferase
VEVDLAERRKEASRSVSTAAGPVVTPEWLKQRAAKDGVRVIHVSPSRRVYNKRHIHGAIFSDLHRDLALRGHAHETGDADREWLLPDREHVERLLRRWGVGEGDHVVLYDDVGLNRHAIRGYWVLRLFRFPKEQLHILDGGIEAWTRAGLETTTTVPEPDLADALRLPVTLGERDESLFATYDEVLDWSREAAKPGGPTRLMDVRTVGEYVGTDVRSKRGGHIPGARQRDFQDLVAEDGTLRPVEQSLAILRGSGIDPDQVRATYCQGAVRAALAWFVLHESAGLEQVKAYGGSWEEWGNRDDSPIETPE